MQNAIDKVHEMFRDPEWVKQFSDADEVLENTMAWVQEMHDKQMAHEARMKALEQGEPLESVGTSWAVMLTAVLITLISFGAACGGTVLLAIYVPELLQSVAALGIIWGTAAGVSFFGVIECAGKLRASRSKRHKRQSAPVSANSEAQSQFESVQEPKFVSQ